MDIKITIFKMKGCTTIFLLIVISVGLKAQYDSCSSQIYSCVDSIEKEVYNTFGRDKVSSELIKNCHILTNLYKGLSYENQIEYGKRLLIIATNIDADSLQKEILEMLAMASFKVSDFESSIDYYYRIFILHSLKKDEINSANTLLSIGHNYYQLSKYIKAKDYYERALLIFKKNQYFIGIARALKGIAVIVGHWGDYDKALTLNQEALSFCKEIGDKESMASIYFNLGSIYQELGDFTNARDNFQMSLELYQELGDINSIVNTTCHIGEIFLVNSLHDQALEYYFKAELIGKKSNDAKLEAQVAYNIGKAYNLKGDYMKALDYQRKALKSFKDLDNKKSLVETYAELGQIYYNLEHYDKSLYYLNMGHQIALEINYKYFLITYSKKLADVYAQLENYKEAYACFNEYINGRDHISHEERKLKTEELQTKYFLTVKQKEVEELKHNEQLNKAQIKTQKLIMLFIIFILFGSLALSIILRLRYLQNRKLNVQLCIQNKEIENQQHEVEKLNSNLQDANASKDKFFSIIAHDLKNPFNSLLGLTDLLIEDYEKMDEKERKEFIVQIKSSGDRIYSLLQNLLLWGRNQLGKIKAVKENIKISVLINEVISITDQNAANKNIKININMDDDIVVFADKNMISTVLLNLISNAIKFTHINGEIEIKCKCNENNIELMVADTGVGISKENQKKLFKVDQKFQTEGTNKEKGTGLGLILCKDFIEKNSGKIWVESEVGAGSWFYFSLPKPAQQ
ncbi:MAG: tetratricopeptide repeat-containing sensor histidine kinase [Bacteroidales bacterium]